MDTHLEKHAIRTSKQALPGLRTTLGLSSGCWSRSSCWSFHVCLGNLRFRGTTQCQSVNLGLYVAWAWGRAWEILRFRRWTSSTYVPEMIFLFLCRPLGSTLYPFMGRTPTLSKQAFKQPTVTVGTVESVLVSVYLVESINKCVGLWVWIHPVPFHQKKWVARSSWRAWLCLYSSFASPRSEYTDHNRKQSRFWPSLVLARRKSPRRREVSSQSTISMPEQSTATDYQEACCSFLFPWRKTQIIDVLGSFFFCQRCKTGSSATEGSSMPTRSSCTNSPRRRRSWGQVISHDASSQILDQEICD
jgi:hypothetical protein